MILRIVVKLPVPDRSDDKKISDIVSKCGEKKERKKKERQKGRSERRRERKTRGRMKGRSEVKEGRLKG